MSTQKQQHSHAATGKGRSHLALKKKTLTTCPHCKEAKLPHHLCPKCQKY
ncbi:MAG TPA: 50S ribosomal protein L32 [Candidatus Jacksonbacteria bacterium]|nr:50S ribosomal protein L32 [Candidatus Jacksonbacteria bacterium]HCC49502.1 50S ribosomal protein L32 [Candidatus Jacksonbacteria bacterium]HCE49575.1 50S ribosomal protein L32 [Candidatus Jacksonbacteria bacterium]HCR14787.1 50S ribosomal protein L32 [Candidatus Jacksonbacteria bacterium]